MDYEKVPQLIFDTSDDDAYEGKDDFIKGHRLLTFNFCAQSLLRTKAQSFLLGNKNGSEHRCVPSLRATTCHLVLHECLVMRQCFDDYHREFRTMDDQTFNCSDDHYFRPSWGERGPFQKKVMVGWRQSDDFFLHYFQSTCSQTHPNIVIEIGKDEPVCRERLFDPLTNCRSFQRDCEEMIHCLMDKKSTCDVSQVMGRVDQALPCDYWGVSMILARMLDNGLAEMNCVSVVVPSEIPNRCDYQAEKCGQVARCQREWNCKWYNHTKIDCTTWFKQRPKNENNVRVYHCNDKFGFKSGISVTYQVSKWICQASYRTYSLTCVQIKSVCKNIVECLDDEDGLRDIDVSLRLESCEGPMESIKSNAKCVKIPVILRENSRHKYLKDCLYASQDSAQIYAEPQPHDTFCCDKGNQQSARTGHIATVVNCTYQQFICDAVMKCYLNFEATILGFLEIFDLKVTSIFHLSFCAVGLVNNLFSLLSKSFGPKMDKNSKMKSILDMVTMIEIACYVALELVVEKLWIPVQVKWFKDGLLKWFLYLFLSLQSLSGISQCLYIGLMTKYPMIVKEINEKTKVGLFALMSVSVLYHLPRLFLDLTISSSLCSLIKTDRVAYSYSLEYQMMKKQGFVHGSESYADTDNFFLHFHQSCHSYFTRVRSSHAFLIYNVVFDSLFCHVVPILTVFYAMTIYVVEIAKLIKRRQDMNFHGKRLSIFNLGTFIFAVQSVTTKIRHSFMIFTSVYIWFHDRANIFLSSTLHEQFSIYVLVAAISITVSNLMVTLAFVFHGK